MRTGASVSRGMAVTSSEEHGRDGKRNTIFSKHYTAIMDSSMDSKRYAQETEPELSPLEQEVLDEYAKLVGNLDNVHCFFLFANLSTDHTDTSLQLSGILAELAANPSVEILDSLRGLERKTATVFTLLKASVYSIVLQQEIRDEDGGSP
jgi:DASH complex subunit DAD3